MHQVRPWSSRANLRALAIFFFGLGWRTPGGRGHLRYQIPRGGDENRQNWREGKCLCPVLNQHCSTFHWSHSRVVHFTVRFFVSVNVYICIFLIAPFYKLGLDVRRHYFMILILLLSFIFFSIVLCPVRCIKSYLFWTYEKVKEVPQIIDRS